MEVHMCIENSGAESKMAAEAEFKMASTVTWRSCASCVSVPETSCKSRERETSREGVSAATGSRSAGGLCAASGVRVLCDVLLLHQVCCAVLLCVVLLQNLQYTAATNINYSFSYCDRPRNDQFEVDGAVVTSQARGTPVRDNLNCTYTYKAVQPYTRFLLQMREVNVAVNKKGTCDDRLGIYDSLSVSQKILHNFCGTFTDLPATFKNGKSYTNGPLLKVTWSTGQRSNRGHDVAFNITLTAVTKGADNCNSAAADGAQFACSRDVCMSASLTCDGVTHCYDGSDEDRDLCPPAAAVPVMESLTGHTATTTTKRTPGDGRPDATTPPQFLGTEQVFLWLPLIVVVIFTLVMIGLITIGRRKEASPESANANESTNEPTVSTSSPAPSAPPPTTRQLPVRPDDGGDDVAYGGSELVYMLVLFLIFVAIVVACLLFAKKDARNQRGPETQAESEALGTTVLDDRNGLSVDVEGNAAYEAEPGQPSTPPPSYSVLERQISYVSHISQSSSQIEEPPDYTDALELPGGEGARVARSASALAGRRNSSAGSRMSRLRNRLFSRSVSANETRLRRNDSSTSTEPPEMPEAVPTHRDSDFPDVFFDLASSSGPQGHSTPHPSSTSSQGSAATGPMAASRHLNSSHLTTISSIDEADIGSTPSIFDHINRLNETSPEVGEGADGCGDGGGGGGSGGEGGGGGDISGGSRDDSDLPHCVSNVALLTNDGAPNNGTRSRDLMD